MSTISTGNAVEGEQTQYQFPIHIGLHPQFTDIKVIRKSVKFPGRLVIPDATFEIPEQEFTTTFTDAGVVFENEPKDSWPKISFMFISDVEKNRFRLDEYLVGPSDRTVDGAILFSRFLYFLSKYHTCSLIAVNSGEVFKVDLRPFSETEGKEFFTIAKLARKLKYIQKVFHVQFSLPTAIPGSDVRKAEIVFRGVTEGEFSIRSSDIWFADVPPSDIDLTSAPFKNGGVFSRKVGNEEILFTRKLYVGPVTISLDKATLGSSRVIEQMGKGLARAIDIRFEVLDNQINYRFETYSKSSRKQRLQKLNEFKRELAREEPQELVDLIDASLQNDVSADEALQIASGWTQYNGLPDRYCPQEPVLSEANDSWRVPIYLVYTNGEGGPVGEVIIDVKTGKIIQHTPIEELRSKGLALAKQILHA